MILNQIAFRILSSITFEITKIQREWKQDLFHVQISELLDFLK